MVYFNRARGDADEPTNPVLVNESTNLPFFMSLWVGLLFSPPQLILTHPPSLAYRVLRVLLELSELCSR